MSLAMMPAPEGARMIIVDRGKVRVLRVLAIATRTYVDGEGHVGLTTDCVVIDHDGEPVAANEEWNPHATKRRFWWPGDSQDLGDVIDALQPS